MPSSSSSFATWGSRLLSLPRHDAHSHEQGQGEGGQQAHAQGVADGQGQGQQASSDLDVLLLSVATPDSIHGGHSISTPSRAVCSNGGSMLDPSAAATERVAVATPLPTTASTALLSTSSSSMASSLSQHHHHPNQSPSPFLPSCPSSSSPPSTPSSSASSSPQQHNSHYSQLQQQPPRIIGTTSVEAAGTTLASPKSEIDRTTTFDYTTVSTTTPQPKSQPQQPSLTATAPQSLQQEQQHHPSLSRFHSTSSFSAFSLPPDRPAPPPPRSPPSPTSSSNNFLRRPTRNPFRTSSSTSYNKQSTTVADPSLPPLATASSLFSFRGKKKKAASTRQEQEKELPPTPPHFSSRSPFAHSNSPHSAPRPPSIRSITSSLSGSIKLSLSKFLRPKQTTSTTNSPSGSLKGSVASSIFSIKRRRRLPLPFWTGDSSPSSSSDTDQEATTPPSRPRSRLASSISKSPSVEFPTTTTMQQVEYMPDSTQYNGPSFHHDVSPLPLHPSSSSSTLQKQTLSSKRMRPPLSEISTANIPSSSTTLISSDANANQLQQLQQQTSYPLSSRSTHKSIIIPTTTRINPNQSSITEDQAKHLHERARFLASSSSSSTQQPPELVTTETALTDCINNNNNNNNNNNDNDGAVIGALGNNSSSRLLDQPSQNTRLHVHGQSVTSPLSETSTPTSATASITTSRTKGDKKWTTRANLSRDARAIKTRIRRLWMDPSQEVHSRMKRDPKNQYLLLEESLTGILQIVPPIIQNARIPKSSPMGLSYPAAAYSDSTSSSSLPHPHPRIMPMSMDFSAATGSTISPPHPLSAPPVQHSFHPPSPSLIGSALPKSSGGSTSNSMTTTATGPVHTRARTTSSNSTSTISATRYQIATSMLQPSESLFMDIAQPTLRSPTSGASLGEPSLSTFAAAAAAAASLSSTSPSLTTDTRPTAPGMAESNNILISKLLSLSNSFTGSIRALCEQQNEKVLRFDDDMILELLTRWEQEAGREEEDGSVSEPDDNSSTTSLVTLGATNALERYQIIVGRVWEETDVILSCIRKIRDLVEFGRMQHYSDFDDDDSEEDAIEKDEVIKKSLYSRILFHANGLVTVLGEFLECVSGIQRLVSTIKTQRESQEDNRDDLNLNNGSSVDNGFDQQSPSVVDFIADDPIPVKHLDPALMRKLKRKNRFKTMAEKVRRSFSDFAKRSTTSLLAVFPPLGDGTNDGFHWDSYSDGEYSEEWVGTEYGGSHVADEDNFVRTLSPPDSPGIRSEKIYGRHRRLSSKDTSGLPEQYWPGSTRLGFSDDGMSPTNSIHPTSPFSTSSSSIPIASGSPGGNFVGGTSMTMSRSMSSERTVNTIATRLHMDSPNNVASPTRKSPEFLRESMELTGHSSSVTDAMAMTSSLQPTPSIQTDVKEKRQSNIFQRKSIQAPTITGISISAPIPIDPRPYSAYSSPGESQTPSRNNYRVRPPRPPNSLPPMPPSPTLAASSQDDSFENSIGSDSSIFKPNSTHRTSSYLASRSISPLQTSPLILDSPFTRQTSIRMGNDRNRYSIKMPEDEQWEHQLSGSNTVLSTNGSSSSSSNGSNNSPRSSGGNFPGSFWRRRSYNDALEKSWQSMRQDSLALSSGGAFDTSLPSTPNGPDFRSTFGLESSSSQAPSRMASFEFMIPFISRDGNAVSSSTTQSRQGSRPESGSALSQVESERMATMTMMGNNNRRHSSPLILGAERALSDALSRRQSASSQKSQSTTNSQPQQQQQPQQQGSSNSNSIHTMPTVDENSKPKNAPHHRQDQDQGPAEAQTQAQAPRSNAPALSTDSVTFTESDALSIKPRPPRPTYKKMSSESNIHHSIAASRHNGPYVATTSEATTSEAHTENTSSGHKELEGLESHISVDPARKPVISPRFGDMKKAWEILNLDVKRLNQYSHMRAYAKGQPIQNNSWALNHPNAQQSTTSPRVLHICENGADVLVMEMFEGHLQVVAGLLEKLIERLADENAQDAEYVSCFLLSHSFFIDSEDLLDRLIARFHIQPRQGEILYFKKWQTVIQVKILCVLMRWIQIQYEDFELNANLLKSLRKFLKVDVRQAGFVMEAECIDKSISIKSLSPIKNCSVIMEQGRFCLQRSRTRKISLSRSQNPPLPSQSSNLTSSTLSPIPQSPGEQTIEYGPTPELAPSSPILQLNGQDLARYLTLADMKAFRSITVFELMSGWWKRRQAADNKLNGGNGGQDEDEPKSPSGLSVVEAECEEDGAIEAFTRRANMLSYWVAHEIVSTAGSKTRKQLIKKFIEVAKICRQLNNLHTSMFIVSALTSKPVRRLNSSWKLVSSKDMETLKNLEALMDPSGNMRCYRQAVAEADAPTIPFLPILLKDITFILDGNSTMIASKANLSPQAQPNLTSAPISTTSDSTTTPTTVTPPPPTTPPTSPKSENTGAPLVNFDKFRRLTQYVENAVDMAKSVDYSFEHQLLRQARVFRPSSPSLYGETDSVYGNGGSSSLLGGKSGSTHGFLNGSSNGGGPAPDGSRGALDHISEIVERRLVKASGLYGVHQRVIQVEFINRVQGSKSNGASSLWKSSGGDGGSNNGSVHGSMVGSGVRSDMVIRAVQGEEEYLMGLSRMCEPARW